MFADEVNRRRPKAVVFDMDGVLVDSARIHARAWKETFDEFLAECGHSEPFVIPDDYRSHVDGRPRYEGVASFLASRGIEMPEGDPSDPPGMETMAAVGNLKNETFHRLLETEDIEPLPGVERLLDRLREDDTPLAVVSSSRNTDRILPEAIARRVDVVFGGKDLDEMQMAGKPAPDMFVRAVAELGVIARDAAVVEDSPAGARAGRRGGFSLVVGVGEDAGSSLVDLADVVVTGVGELPRNAASWSDLLEPPPSALANIDAIRRLVGDRLESDASSLRVGVDEGELLEARQSDGVGVLVDPDPPPMTWADFSVTDPEEESELRRRVVGPEAQSAD